MADFANSWPSDPRATRRDLLLARLEQMLDALRRDGVAPPVALEELLARNRTPLPPP